MKKNTTKIILATALCLGVQEAVLAQTETVNYGVDINSGGTQKRTTTGNISATNDISGSGQNVTYAAGGTITLKTGFSVTGDAKFTARKFDPNIDSRLSAEELLTENSLESEFKIYPNPFQERTTIEFSPDKKFKNEVVIYNTSGLEVKRISLRDNKSFSSGKIEVDASDLPAGIYIFETTVGKKTMTRKILKF